jgi:ribose/xylose/arabinose/galactoside ABC-type transport system permease subunit
MTEMSMTVQVVVARVLIMREVLMTSKVVEEGDSVCFAVGFVVGFVVGIVVVVVVIRVVVCQVVMVVIRVGVCQVVMVGEWCICRNYQDGMDWMREGVYAWI